MKTKLLLLITLITFTIHAQDAFITKWEITNTAPVWVYTSGAFSGYNFTINWGDGTTDSNITESKFHQYTTPGEYNITITGSYPNLRFEVNGNFEERLLEVVQWGTSQWESMESMFEGCSKLILTATDTPDLSNVTNMSNMFRNARNFNQNINNWDVSNITNMNGLFSRAQTFNQDLSSWNVSNVTNMSSLFNDATVFNQNIGPWNVGKVTNMNNMFYLASAFNQDISNWNLENVEFMSLMFRETKNFNQNISSWNVNKVKSLVNTFYKAEKFNQNLSSWNVGSATEMSDIFSFSNLSTENYDAILTGWSNLPNLQQNVVFGATEINYCNSETARNKLITDFNWTVTDAGKDCTSLSIDNYLEESINIYPNPTVTKIKILVTDNSILNEIEVFNLLGKEMIKTNKLEIDISSFSNGIYILKIETNKGQVLRKIIKE